MRAELRNTETIKFGLGVGASVSMVELLLAFRQVEEGVWLPSRVSAIAVGKKLLFSRFRVRTTALYSHYRQFGAETEETVRPPH